MDEFGDLRLPFSLSIDGGRNLGSARIHVRVFGSNEFDCDIEITPFSGSTQPATAKQPKFLHLWCFVSPSSKRFDPLTAQLRLTV